MSKNHSFAQADATRRHGMPSDCNTHQIPMKAGAMDRLTAWFSGEIALTRSDAHRLLESAVESGHIAQYRAEFVAAIKALAAGQRSWHDMGYRLLPDD
ncbi:MAG: hypothetical protein Q7T69_20900 [Rhodoferax sp.]|nr:hypothetical protein [Rhodoferax sp.]